MVAAKTGYFDDNVSTSVARIAGSRPGHRARAARQPGRERSRLRLGRRRQRRRRDGDTARGLPVDPTDRCGARRRAPPTGPTRSRACRPTHVLRELERTTRSSRRRRATCAEWRRRPSTRASVADRRRPRSGDDRRVVAGEGRQRRRRPHLARRRDHERRRDLRDSGSGRLDRSRAIIAQISFWYGNFPRDRSAATRRRCTWC